MATTTISADSLANTSTRRPVVLATWITLALITALGAVLRSWGLNHSLWLDELHTTWCVSAGLGELPSRAAQGNYPPLFPFLVWVSQSVFGLSEVSLRLPSVVAGTLLIPAAFCVLWGITCSKAVGLWAALLVVLDGTFIYFSQEARASACVQLTVLVNYGLFYVMVSGDSSRHWLSQRRLRVLWVLSALAVFYLHYTGVLALVGQPLWFVAMRLIAWRRARKKQGKTQYEGDGPSYRSLDFVTDLSIAALGCLPALPHLVEIASHREEWRQFVPPRSLDDALTTFPLVSYLAGPALSLLIMGVLFYRRSAPAVDASYTETAATAERRSKRRRRRKGTQPQNMPGDVATPAATPGLQRTALGSLLACWYLAPLLIAWAADMVHARYVIGTAVALPFVAGWVIGSRQYLTVQVLLAAAVLVPLQARDDAAPIGLIQQYRLSSTFSGHFYEDWRSAVAWVRQQDPQASLPVYVQPRSIEVARLTDARYAVDSRFRQYLVFPVTNGLYSLKEFDLATLPPGNVTLDDREIVTLDDRETQKVVDRGGAWFLVRLGSKPRPAFAPLFNAIRKLKHKPTFQGERIFSGVLVVRIVVTK